MDTVRLLFVIKHLYNAHPSGKTSEALGELPLPENHDRKLQMSNADLINSALTTSR